MLQQHDDTNVAAMSSLRSSAGSTKVDTATSLKSRPSLAAARAKSEPLLHCSSTKHAAKAPPPRSALKKQHAQSPVPVTTRSRVKFGMVDIREYPIIPGDNPGGNEGPPITIDWCVQRHVTANIDEYEKAHPEHRTPAQCHMPRQVRHELLHKSGFSSEEILNCTKQANIIRGQRRRASVEFSQKSRLSEAKERMTRGFSNLTFGKDKKQKERDFIQQKDSKKKKNVKNNVTKKASSGGQPDVTKPAERGQVLERRSSSQTTVVETVCPDEEEICA